jgi:hypothetical protein
MHDKVDKVYRLMNPLAIQAMWKVQQMREAWSMLQGRNGPQGLVHTSSSDLDDTLAKTYVPVHPILYPRKNKSV